MALLAFYFVLNYTLSWVSLFVLRRREPDPPRPYRALGYPWVTGLLLVGAVVFLVANVVGDFPHARWFLFLLALSYPVFRLVARSRPPSS